MRCAAADRLMDMGSGHSRLRVTPPPTITRITALYRVDIPTMRRSGYFMFVFTCRAVVVRRHSAIVRTCVASPPVLPILL